MTEGRRWYRNRRKGGNWRAIGKNLRGFSELKREGRAEEKPDGLTQGREGNGEMEKEK